MKIEALQSLQTVLATGSFVRAAGDLGLTPSAVSLQMKQLEQFFGKPLFDRSGRVVQPTPFALEMAAAVRQSLATIEGFRARRAPSASGVLRLGVIPSVQKMAMPHALRVLQNDHPDLVIQLMLDVSATLQTAVKAGRIDAAILVRPKTGGSGRLHWCDLTRENFVLLAPGNSTGATPRQLLRQYPWIRYDVALTGGRAAADYVRRTCPGTVCRFEIASTDAIAAMVAAGLGVSVVPRLRERLRESYALREIDLGPKAPTRQISLLARRADEEDRRILAVEDAFRAAYEVVK
ncbi:putative hydrogen peroxide-inducible genes activator (plasmid) [Variovorax sp. SRS16]|uniref:LysR family transcriptional regulator n=1 Tax=Variovorax sp. SRS16 TaxID=282217 RepID=UPI001317FC80|nr:LysR family transcriptional regulator [Variovorax sp. SRS16]VTU46423.1 putative hydrogen peroxide-inducible genes activator [Variovorax sp. SRS16]